MLVCRFIRVIKMLLLLVLFAVTIAGQSSVKKCDHSTEIQCDDGACIDKLVWCDAEVHCLDESDEKYCNGAIPCNPDTHFECKNKKCVPLSAVCDEYDHCDDGSDEKNCSGSTGFQDSPSLNDGHFVPSSNSQNFSAATSSYSDSIKNAVDKAVGYLLNMRDSDYGWGAFTPRAVVALSLASEVSPVAEKNKQLMLKQLNIQLLQDLMKHGNMTLSNLSLYINALYATCQDPRNFQGMDLVARLRSETDSAIQLKTSIPLVFLTLCLSNATKYSDYYKLADMYNSKDFSMRTGSRALVILAMSCIMHKDDTGIFGAYMSHFFSKEMIDSVQIADIYTQTLFMQASTAAEIYYPIEIASKQLPDGSFGDMLSTYYAIPVILKSSLLDLVCNSLSKRSISERDLYRPTGSKEVLYSLWIPSGKDSISHSIKVNFDENESFFNIMKSAASRDSLYRFLYEELDEGKRVYSIAGIPNDIESGAYWLLYTSDANYTKINSDQRLELLDISIDKIFPDDKDHLIFWLRGNRPEDGSF